MGLTANLFEAKPGAKRSFDDVYFEIGRLEEARKAKDEIDIYETFDMYRDRRRLAEPTLSVAVIQQEFNDMVEDPDHHALWCRNQWLVAHFRGIEVRRGTAESVVVKSSLAGDVKSDEYLRRYQSHGKRALTDFLGSCSAPGVTPRAEDYPAEGLGTEADQPSEAQIVDSVVPQMLREVVDLLGTPFHPSIFYIKN